MYSALFESITPRSCHTYLITDCDYLIDNRDIILGMIPLKVEFSTKSFSLGVRIVRRL
jgi:hypothetical protein